MIQNHLHHNIFKSKEQISQDRGIEIVSTRTTQTFCSLITRYMVKLFATVSYPRSGPMRECRRSMARAWALVRLAVGSPLMARMRSPTPRRPSRLMEPPWIMLRISIPKPSFMALTVIPLRWGWGVKFELVVHWQITRQRFIAANVA